MNFSGRSAHGVWAAASLAVLLLLAGCGIKDPIVPTKASIEETVLFPTNDRVLTTYCPAGPPATLKCYLAAWDLDGGNFKVYRKPAHHSWRDGRFSPDGTEIVFRLNDTGRYSTKLAIMTLATKQLRIVESTDRYKLWPSYHPNGKKLIFATVSQTPDNTEPSPGVSVAGVDMHSLDLATGETKALTDYEFQQAARAYYTGRGDEFVYGGYFPMKIFLNRHNKKFYALEKNYEYKEKYRGDSIITVNEHQNDWRPDFVMDSSSELTFKAYAVDAVPSKNGAILYFQSDAEESKANRMSTYSTAIWIRTNDANRRLMYFSEVTNFHENFTDFTLSSDEQYFLIWSRGYPVGAKDHDEGLWRVGVDGSGPRRIPIPWDNLATSTRSGQGQH